MGYLLLIEIWKDAFQNEPIMSVLYKYSQTGNTLQSLSSLIENKTRDSIKGDAVVWSNVFLLKDKESSFTEMIESSCVSMICFIYKIKAYLSI